MTTTDTPSEQFWENRYRDMDPQWGTKPNAVLHGLLPALSTELAIRQGTALDIGCGHGGDAVWLASLGWRVTAVDVAPTAVTRTTEAAAAAGVELTAVCHDLSRSFPDGTFDLVTASYFHTPVDIPRDAVLRRGAAAVAPGGLLVIVEHASAAPWSEFPDGKVPHFPTPQESLDSLRLGTGWLTRRLHAPQRTATGPGDQTAVVTDNVIAVQRP